jgi:hypothetical protein
MACNGEQSANALNYSPMCLSINRNAIRAGEVAQEWGPEFKPWCCQKKKKEIQDIEKEIADIENYFNWICKLGSASFLPAAWKEKSHSIGGHG